MRKPKLIKELERLTTEELQKENDEAWEYYKKVKQVYHYRLLCEGNF